ncbi:MAG: hypothetical protein AAJB65_00465 [Candidatus Hodgkinia cicadicola]
MKIKVKGSNLENIIKAINQRNRIEGISRQIRFKERYLKLKSKSNPPAHANLNTHSWEFQEIN